MHTERTLRNLCVEPDASTAGAAAAGPIVLALRPIRTHTGATSKPPRAAQPPRLETARSRARLDAGWMLSRDKSRIQLLS